MTKLTEAVAKAIRDADDDMQPRENWEYYIEHAEAAIRIVLEEYEAKIAEKDARIEELERRRDNIRDDCMQAARKIIHVLEQGGMTPAKALRDGGER